MLDLRVSRTLDSNLRELDFLHSGKRRLLNKFFRVLIRARHIHAGGARAGRTG